MGKKTKKKDEIVIINKFKENSVEDVRVKLLIFILNHGKSRT